MYSDGGLIPIARARSVIVSAATPRSVMICTARSCISASVSWRRRKRRSVKVAFASLTVASLPLQSQKDYPLNL